MSNPINQPMADSADKEFYITLGARIRSARINAGFTQEGFGEILGLSRSSIANIEKGRQNPQIHTLCYIAKVLRIEVEKLLPSTALPSVINPELKKLVSNEEKLMEFIQQISFQKLMKDE